MHNHATHRFAKVHQEKIQKAYQRLFQESQPFTIMGHAHTARLHGKLQRSFARYLYAHTF
jgi:hypothetical protein